MSRRTTHGLAFLSEDRPAEAFEQLDSAMRIVGVKSWLVLCVVGLTFASFVVFACLYRAPLKVEGRGIILARTTGEDSLLHVTALSSGRIEKVLVTIGDEVTVGQELAVIDQQDLLDQIEQLKSERDRLVEENRRLSAFDDTEGALKKDTLDKLRTTLDKNLRLDSLRLERHKEIVGRDRALRKRQMLSDIDAIKTQSESDAVESAVGATTAKLHEVDYNLLSDQVTRDKERLKRDQGIKNTERLLEVKLARHRRDARIVATHAGRIVDLMITQHGAIEKGAPAALLRVEKTPQAPMEAIVFVPAGIGKRIRPSMPVEVAPDTVRRQEHGFVFGKVRSVSEIPATEAAMLAELKHKNLVASFSEQYAGQVLLLIHIDLEKDDRPDSVAALERMNWLRWSSSSGAHQRVSSGTLCGAEVVVEKRPLIALAFPWARNLVGYY